MTPASEGLGRYYEHVLKSMHAAELKVPMDATDEELDRIEEEEYLDEFDDEDYLAHWDVDNKVYH